MLEKKLPFYNLKNDPQVIAAILTGRLPEKPETSSGWPTHYNRIWEICEECWLKEPTARPRIDAVVAKLKIIVVPFDKLLS